VTQPPSDQNGGVPRRRGTGQRRALGALFALLALGFAGIAVTAAGSDAGTGRRVVVAVAAGALAVWLLGLCAKALR